MLLSIQSSEFNIKYGVVIWESYTSQKMLRSSVTPPPEEYWSFLRKALFN